MNQHFLSRETFSGAAPPALLPGSLWQRDRSRGLSSTAQIEPPATREGQRGRAGSPLTAGTLASGTVPWRARLFASPVGDCSRSFASPFLPSAVPAASPARGTGCGTAGASPRASPPVSRPAEPWAHAGPASARPLRAPAPRWPATPPWDALPTTALRPTGTRSWLKVK